PRERRDFGWIMRDEDRAAQLRLDELLEELELHLARAVLRAKLDAVALAERGERLAVPEPLLRQRVSEAAELEQRVLEPEPRKRPAEVEALALVFDVRRAEHRPRRLAHELLRERHHVLVVRVRLIELEDRELGVVARRQPFVPERTPDLVDALEAADQQSLQ